MSIALAICDFIPVAMFAITAIILNRDLFGKMGRVSFSCFSAGTCMIFLAGTFKALWKLLFCAGICDFEKLNKCFMPMQAAGFFLAALGMLLMRYSRKRSPELLSAAAVPAVYEGTMPCVVMMCLGIAVICGELSNLAKRLGKKNCSILFLVALIGLLLMGYLSSGNYEEALLNWIAEIINIIAQGALLGGVILLDKAGLKQLDAISVRPTRRK